MNDLERRLATAQRRAIAQRNYRRIRDRALARLRSQFPEVYLQLLEEEKIRDEQEGKTWVDLSGNTHSNHHHTRSASNSISAQERKSTDEGEL